MKKSIIIAAVLVLTGAWSGHFYFLPVQKASALDSAPVLEHSIAEEKKIIVGLDSQTLTYFEGERIIGEIKISSGLKRTPTPLGEFEVLVKRPVVHYAGPNFNYPNTKWNLMFKRKEGGNYYIHGAYWHSKFGQPMSGGCVNVSYADMEPLYNWAEVGTKVTIKEVADRHQKGSVVLSEGTVYYLGQDLRYPFPSPEVFFSWGWKFEDVRFANPADLAMPLGPIVEFRI
jgi:hypothetical protein